MAYQMRFDTSELKAWVRNQPNRDRAKRQALVVMKNELLDQVITEVKVHTSTGQLENSVIGIADDHKIQIKSAIYGDIVLQYGRAPGVFPPIKPLEEWAQRHGMPRGMGFVIARNIAQRGTEKYWTGTDSVSGAQLDEIEMRFEHDIMPNRMYILLNEYTK